MVLFANRLRFCQHVLPTSLVQGSKTDQAPASAVADPAQDICGVSKMPRRPMQGQPQARQQPLGFQI